MSSPYPSGYGRDLDVNPQTTAFGASAERQHLGGWLPLASGSLRGYPAPMARTQQTFTNSKDGPIYVSVEPWPECFELEPGDKLTLVWDASTTGDTMQVDFINEREVVVWPDGAIDDITYLFNGQPGKDRSWTFKHR